MGDGVGLSQSKDLGPEIGCGSLYSGFHRLRPLGAWHTFP